MFFLPPLTHLFLIVIIIVWLLALTVLNLKHIFFVRRLTQGKSKTNLEESLKQLLSQQDDSTRKIKTILAQIEHLRVSAQDHYQKIGFVRFNPYADTGGNQSFCLCLLNDYNDGIVITSLHSREQTRIYAKQVSHDALDQKDFSKEETESIRQAKSISKKSI